jgi:hypothetical protein
MLSITTNGFQRGANRLVLGDSSKPLVLTGNGIQQGDVSVNLVSSTSLVLSDIGIRSSSGASLFPNDNLFNDPTFQLIIPAGQVVSGIKPPAATGMTATVVSATQVDLAWDIVQYVQVSGYKIDRMEETEQKWTTIVTVNSGSNTYSDTGLSAGTFSYRVSAVNSVGDGATSNVATVVTLPRPTGLTSTAVSGTQINLSWTAPSGSITGYKIERSYDGLVWPTDPLVANTGSTSTLYSDQNLLNNTVYYYRVSAINTGQVSSVSSTRTWSKPSQPTLLSVTTVSSTQLNLSWTAPVSNGGTNIRGYQIERSLNNGVFAIIVTNTESLLTTYSNTGLAVSEFYTYRVSAVNDVGVGESNEASGITFPDKPRITAFTNDFPEPDGPYLRGFDANWRVDNLGSSRILEMHFDVQVSTDTENSINGYPEYVILPESFSLRGYATVMGGYHSAAYPPHKMLPPLSPLGNTFRIRARARNSAGFSLYSDWSDYVYMSDEPNPWASG